MKTQGEFEAAICDGMTRFEQEYMGRGPKDIHAHLIGDLLVVCHFVVSLTAAEQQLIKTLPARERAEPAQRGSNPADRDGAADP